MSSKVSFFPGGDAALGIWMNNFSSKLGTHATSVGVSSAEVTSTQKDAAFYNYTVNLVELAKQTVNNMVGYKKLLKHASAQQHLSALPVFPTAATPPPAVAEGMLDRISKMVVRIKASVNYTDSIGQDLGIIAPETTIDASTLQPNLTVKLDAGRPHIKCSKGIADGVDLYVDRNDGQGFVFVVRLLKLDYIDTASLPAATPFADWHYKALYIIGNDNVGLMSSVVSVIVKKM
jgi:hypothetical protein